MTFEWGKLPCITPVITEASRHGAWLKWKLLPCISELLSAVSCFHLTGTCRHGVSGCVPVQITRWHHSILMSGQHPDVAWRLLARLAEEWVLWGWTRNVSGTHTGLRCYCFEASLDCLCRYPVPCTLAGCYLSSYGGVLDHWCHTHRGLINSLHCFSSALEKAPLLWKTNRQYQLYVVK